MVFEKISKHSLEVNNYDRAVHLVQPAPKVVPVCPFIELVCGRHHMHFKIVLLHLLNLVVLR